MFQIYRLFVYTIYRPFKLNNAIEARPLKKQLLSWCRNYGIYAPETSSYKRFSLLGSLKHVLKLL